MKFDLITIFPKFFDGPLSAGLLGKAVEAGAIQVAIHDLRDWAEAPHYKVDDEPFGGGPGMVMAPGPLVRAVREVRGPDSAVVSLTPSGTRFGQRDAARLARVSQLILICGRYEGVDARVAEILGAEEFSVGDFVTTGGEAPALCVLEATARLVPEFVGNPESLDQESFGAGLLEYPQFTRPADFEGSHVPDVLLSGDHGRIERWRREQAIRRTFESRPDLIEGADLTEAEREMIDSWLRGP